MNTYTFKIGLQSDTLVGSAGGHGSLIDSEVVFDEYGIPYIPGKRIKGLLRDSLMEVVAMLSQNGKSGIDRETVKIIFGKAGSEHFSKFFVDEDLHIKD
jgi:CRISPR/Cas system CMR subunit Cmr4 (Cas7 group RAMP superfamily)